MAVTYGLPTGTNITYGATGFPQWVYQLATAFGLQASTYPDHQESERAEAGFAPNPQRLNRGIDWTGSVENMQRFADYLLTIRGSLEQVIWCNPVTGKRVGVAGGDDVSATAYYDADYGGHRDHVHTRQSQPIPLPNQGVSTVGWTGDPVWLADVLKSYDGGPALKVRELPDWRDYGHGDFGDLWGVMVHHTGNAVETPESIRHGRPDLEGPLANLHIAQDGTAPHLHLSDMPHGYDPAAKQDPLPRLRGALDPAVGAVLVNRQEKPVTQPGRPDFNEYAVWTPNHQDRAGTKIDLFLLHTQEGNGNADQLARWLGGPNGVSYHYTISMDPMDKGVTVCDVVDTDLASWSVLSANNRSINLCFAGSRAAWSRQDWLDKAGRAIDVAAYLAVQDCRKYSIPVTVIAPPYITGRAGISDHNYVTKVLKDGTHTDIGRGFPWDVFTAAVNKYAGTAPVKPPAPATALTLTNEFDAITYGDLDAIKIVVRAAHQGDKRASRALTRIEQTNPAALKTLIESVKR